jgi:hypothetical protein
VIDCPAATGDAYSSDQLPPATPPVIALAKSNESAALMMLVAPAENVPESKVAFVPLLIKKTVPFTLAPPDVTNPNSNCIRVEA